MCLSVSGAWAGAVDFVEVQSEGADGTVTGLALVSAVAVSPDGKNVYGAGTLDDAIAVFQRNADTGRLVYIDARKQGEQRTGDAAAVSGLDKPIRLAVAPDGGRLFAVSLTDGTLAVFGRDSATGRLVFQQALSSADLVLARALAVSPDGSNVYVAGDNADGAGELVTFSVGAAGVTELTGSTLQEGSGVSGLADAADMTLSPDGRYLYVSSAADAAVAVLARDSGTGTLTFQEAVDNGSDGVSGLQSPEQLVISGDGRNLYVGDAAAKAIFVFGRDADSGGLSFVQASADGQSDDFGNTVTGLDGVYALAISPEGSQLYAAGENGNTLAVFHRSSDSGRLTAADILTDGQNGVDGLGKVLDLAVSPDGRSLYSAASVENKVGVFDIAAADLNLAMTADSVSANAGRPLHYNFVVTNNGPDDATHVTVSDVLPAGLTYVPASGQSPCSLIGGAVICKLGTLATGTMADVTVSATVSGSAAVANSAQAAADQRDPSPGDNLSAVNLPFNNPPTAVDDSAAANPGVAAAVNVLANDSDPDGDPLSVSAFEAESADGGTVTQGGSGILMYTAPADAGGKQDSFHYTVSDGRGGSATATVTVTVNTPPVAVDDHATTTKDTPVTIYVLANDHDPDGDPFTITALGSPSQAGAKVTNNNDGTVTYTPPAGFIGADSFTYTVTDSLGASVTATVTVDIQAARSTSAGGISGGSNGGAGSAQTGTDGGGGALNEATLGVLAGLGLLMRRRKYQK